MADSAIVKPQPISGFPEWLPEEKLVEERLLRVIREEFERYAFTPLETAAVERKEVLQAKGVVEKEIYALSRLAAEAEGGDAGTEMALHFDLTVPLARYVAQNFARLVFPFRRYQIQKVWRGERPQAGRFREFYQCDIDIVGNGALGLLADAEIPLVINAIFERVGIGRFLIRINNRKILQGFLEHAGVPDPAFAQALRIVDALEKIGEAKVLVQLENELGLDADVASTILAFVTRGGGHRQALKAFDGGPRYQAGRRRTRRGDRGAGGARHAAGELDGRPVDRPRPRLTTPAPSTRRAPGSHHSGRSAASAPAAATTTWRSSFTKQRLPRRRHLDRADPDAVAAVRRRPPDAGPGRRRPPRGAGDRDGPGRSWPNCLAIAAELRARRPSPPRGLQRTEEARPAAEIRRPRKGSGWRSFWARRRREPAGSC